MTADDKIPPIMILSQPMHGAHSTHFRQPNLDTLSRAKLAFLARVNVKKGDREKAWSKSWAASVQTRGKSSADGQTGAIYAKEATGIKPAKPLARRAALQSSANRIVVSIAQCYNDPPSDVEHELNIERISNRLSAEFSPLLNRGRLRIGTAQKFFNLYLKYLWCFDEIVEPPQCPLDRVVQYRAGLPAAQIVSWSKLDDITEYHGAIERLRKMAASRPSERMSLAQWELLYGW